MGFSEVEAIFYIELLGKERKEVEEALYRIKKGLMSEKFRVKRLDVGDVIEDPEMAPLSFSAFVETQIKAPLDSIFDAVVKYSPIMVEVLGPGRMEVSNDELSSLLNGLVRRVSEFMRKANYTPHIPDLREVPSPRIGFEDEELWELVYQGRNLLYSLKFHLKAENESFVKEAVPKLLLLESVGTNSLELSLDGDFIVDVEAVSPLESLVNLSVKYLPSEIKILEPEVVDITASELQNSLSDVGSFLSSLKLKEEKRMAYESDVFSFRLSKSI